MPNPIHLLTSKIGQVFDKIGKTNGTAPPHSDDNRFSLAWDYFVADKLAAAATKRKEKAKAAAMSAGLLGAPDGFKSGTTITTFDNELFSINAKTANPAERIDRSALSVELLKEVGEAKANLILNAATKKNKAAVTYEFAVKP